MNIEEKKTINEENKDLMCVTCKSFFGNQATLKMCSQCFKKHQVTLTPKKTEPEKVQSIVLAVKKEENKLEEVKKEVNKDRCSTCSRKLKLLGIECRCGLYFCNAHRLPQDHTCSFNHKNMGKQKLSKQVIKVEKGKIQLI